MTTANTNTKSTSNVASRAIAGWKGTLRWLTRSFALRSRGSRKISVRRPTSAAPKRQPRYHVILWNDDDHSYDYVIKMMRELFGHPEPQGKQIARQVDTQGKAICLTTTMEHADEAPPDSRFR